jgi:hypothetical protein
MRTTYRGFTFTQAEDGRVRVTTEVGHYVGDYPSQAAAARAIDYAITEGGN